MTGLQIDKPSVADAQALNDLLAVPARPAEAQAPDAADPAAYNRSELHDNAEYAYARWDLGDKPAVFGRLANIPFLGGLLAFGRELYGSLWLKANRRSPFAQQVDLNQAIARALHALSWYIDDHDQIWIRLDRDLQLTRTGVGMIDSDLLRLQQQVNALQARLAVLEAKAAIGATGDSVPGSPQAKP